MEIGDGTGGGSGGGGEFHKEDAKSHEEPLDNGLLDVEEHGGDVSKGEAKEWETVKRRQVEGGDTQELDNALGLDGRSAKAGKLAHQTVEGRWEAAQQAVDHHKFAEDVDGVRGQELVEADFVKPRSGETRVMDITSVPEVSSDADGHGQGVGDASRSLGAKDQMTKAGARLALVGQKDGASRSCGGLFRGHDGRKLWLLLLAKSE